MALHDSPTAFANAEISQAERVRLIDLTLINHARRDVWATLSACDALMAALRDRLPAPVFADAAPNFASLRADCEVWADYASDGQIAAMMEACLGRIGGARVALADRKRLFVALWNGLPPEEKRAFSDKVMKKEA